jgi:hypothetical protein
VKKRTRKIANLVRCGAEFVACFLTVYFAGGPCAARDMMGVFDFQNKAVISCTYKNIQYIGCGIYLCEGFENGPGAKRDKLNFVPFSALPESVRTEAERFGSKAPKTVRDKYGNLVKVNLPRETALIDVFIPERTRFAYLRDQNKAIQAGLPQDALFAIAGVSGIGVCDVQGNLLVEPKYPSLVIGGADSGKVSGMEWDEAKKKLVQVQVSFPLNKVIGVSNAAKKPPQQPESAKKLYEGLTAFRSPDGLYGYENEKGDIVIPAKYFSAGHFSGGVAAVRLNPWQGPEKGQHCFIDKTGKIASPIFWRIWGFYGDYALVCERGGEPSLRGQYRRDNYGIIDRNYEYVVPLAPQTIKYLPDGYWAIGNGGGPTVILDRHLKEIFRTPERASLCNESGDTHIFMTTGAGKRKLLYYDKDWKLVNEVEGDPGQRSSQPSIITKGLTFGYEVQSAVVDEKGNFSIPYENAKFLYAESDRFIKTEFGTTFVKEDWDIPNRGRSREFQLFVKQYKLVGMKRREVESLLGPGNSRNGNSNAYYTISGFGASCGNAVTSVEIEYDNDVVSRWRYRNIGSRYEWNQ